MSLLELTLKELLDRLTSEAGRDPNAIAGWVNIRREGFPWRHMVMDAESGRAEVSRVGRKLMAREAEIDRWLRAKGISGHSAKQSPASKEAEAHPSGCDCVRCEKMLVARTLRAAGVFVQDPTDAEIEAEEQHRKTPEYKAEQEAHDAYYEERERLRERGELPQQIRKAREDAERIPRQEAALKYIAKHHRLTAKEHCRQHRVRHWYGYRDLKPWSMQANSCARGSARTLYSSCPA